MTHTSMFMALVILGLSGAAHAGGRSAAEQADKVIARLDGDRDGKLSAKEVEPAAKLARHFAIIDEDRDGFVTRAELVAALERLRARGGAGR
jgi:Ca2+-binding EF-hand superfamily protein